MTRTLMVALRWDGNRLTKQQLMAKAATAAQKLDVAFNHLDKLDVQAMPDETGQYVQLVIRTDCEEGEATRMQTLLKQEFAKA